ncbi:MAG: hypothetical protein LUO82_03645 [Methanomicrobiales archaeon]|nr:hypothetical protein [Methanomicrobiales archaeon]
MDEGSVEEGIPVDEEQRDKVLKERQYWQERLRKLCNEVEQGCKYGKVWHHHPVISFSALKEKLQKNNLWIEKVDDTDSDISPESHTE